MIILKIIKQLFNIIIKTILQYPSIFHTIIQRVKEKEEGEAKEAAFFISRSTIR